VQFDDADDACGIEWVLEADAYRLIAVVAQVAAGVNDEPADACVAERVRDEVDEAALARGADVERAGRW
jgi:hypothetical protein